MKKIVLAIAIAVSMSNLAIGITYAAVCQDTNGNRYCGQELQTPPAAAVVNARGTCRDKEYDWVGGGKGGAEELEEVYDY
jgi:hypothetical protein